MTKKQKNILCRIVAALPFFIGAIALRTLFPSLPFYLHILFFLPAYLLVGYDVLWDALCNIAKGRVFDEQFLMTVATLGAFAIGEYPEAVFVMLFFRVGEIFEESATHHARASLRELASLVPDTARVLLADGAEESTDAEDVAVGTLIRVLPGERIPLDGVVEAGSAALDLSALSGEPLPVDTGIGDTVAAGAVNLDGVLTVRTTRGAEESTAARILEMVENATDRKAKVESFITRFSRVYTPAVCALAVAVAGLLLLLGNPLAESVRTALSFLVISCPCALVISVPLSFFAGIGGAAKEGILFKGSKELERLAAVNAAAFDKTGTLTHGTFRPTAILPAEGVSPDALLFAAASLETASTHPIARSVTAAYLSAHPSETLPAPENVLQTAGGGIEGYVLGKRIAVGNRRYLSESGFGEMLPPEHTGEGSALYVVEENVYLGTVVISDELRAEAKDALAALRKQAISPLLLISGDREKTASSVGKAVGVDRTYGDCLPADKTRLLEEEKEKAGRRFLFVGDGINDAPTLAAAHCGIAMGALGTDAAQLAADVVLLKDGLTDVPRAVKRARRTLCIVWQNIVFSLGVKLAVMVLSSFSLVGMWAAVFADVGVSVLAILNAMRASRCK